MDEKIAAGCLGTAIVLVSQLLSVPKELLDKQLLAAGFCLASAIPLLTGGLYAIACGWRPDIRRADVMLIYLGTILTLLAVYFVLAHFDNLLGAYFLLASAISAVWTWLVIPKH